MLNFIFSLNITSPVWLCLSLIIISLMTGFILNSLISNWLLMTILIVFLGGIIIVFVYTTALSRTTSFHSNTQVVKLKGIELFIPFLGLTVYSAPSKNSVQEIFLINKFVYILIIVILLIIILFVGVKLVQSFKGAIKYFL